MWIKQKLLLGLFIDFEVWFINTNIVFCYFEDLDLKPSTPLLHIKRFVLWKRAAAVGCCVFRCTSMANDIILDESAGKRR